MKMPAQKPGKSKQDYQTPPELLEAVCYRLKIDKFTLDVACTKVNCVAPLGIYSPEYDSLKEPWGGWHEGWCWCNPPYSDIRPWVEKAGDEAFKNGTKTAMLVPASVGSGWWRDEVESDAYVSFLSPRLTFGGCTTPYPKDCALLLYTPWGFIGHEIWNWKHTFNEIPKLEITDGIHE